MTQSTPHRGWMLWGVLLVFVLLVPTLLVGCSDNKGSKGPSYGSSITGTATGDNLILTITINPNAIPPGGTAGITVTATTLNGAPLANEDVFMRTAGGTLSKVSGKTDAAGKFVTSITVDVKETAKVIEIGATVMKLAVVQNLNVLQPGTLAIQPAWVIMAPGATQVFQASGGVEPYRWEASGGTLNRYNEPTVIFTAGNATGDFTLLVRDAAGNSASASITISVTALTISPTTATLQPGQTQSFTATGGTSPYSWNASGGSLNATTGSSVTYTAGNVAGTFEVRVTDSSGQSKPATITILGVGFVTVSANPGSVACGGTSTITATVLSEKGTPLAGVQVTFSATKGTLTATTATTNGAGQAVVGWTATASSIATCVSGASGDSETATISAYAGGKTGSIDVTVVKP